MISKCFRVHGASCERNSLLLAEAYCVQGPCIYRSALENRDNNVPRQLSNDRMMRRAVITEERSCTRDTCENAEGTASVPNRSLPSLPPRPVLRITWTMRNHLINRLFISRYTAPRRSFRGVSRQNATEIFLFPFSFFFFVLIESTKPLPLLCEYFNFNSNVYGMRSVRATAFGLF